MRQSVGMSAQLNMIIVFILIVFALMAASLSYYKAYKVSNAIIKNIEMYEGTSDLKKENSKIKNQLSSYGYTRLNVDCDNEKDENLSDSSDGYCVYLEKQIEEINDDEGSKITGYRYRVVTYMYLDLPIIDMIKVPVTKYTNTIHCFKDNCANLNSN